MKINAVLIKCNIDGRESMDNRFDKEGCVKITMKCSYTLTAEAHLSQSGVVGIGAGGISSSFKDSSDLKVQKIYNILNLLSLIFGLRTQKVTLKIFFQ